MAAGAALALGGRAEIDTEVGYLPFRQHRDLSQAWRSAYLAGSRGVAALLDDRGGAAAAGDVGDLSYLLPCVQLGYSGFSGTVHGRDFALTEPEFVLAAFPRFVAAGLERLGDRLGDQRRALRGDHRSRRGEAHRGRRRLTPARHDTGRDLSPRDRSCAG